MNQFRVLPQLSGDDFEQKFGQRHLVHQVTLKWARERPDSFAIISADTGQGMTWAELEAATLGLAAHLRELGYKWDRV